MDPFTIAMLAQLGISGFQGIKAMTDAKSFEGQKQPSYRENSQELEQNRFLAERQMKQGMSPEAKALASNTFNTQQAGAYRAATENSGGQLSNAISRMGALNNVNFGLNLGAQDQAARERGQSAYMGVNQQLQGERDKDTGIAAQNYAQTRQNIQGMSQYALQNFGNAVSGYAAGAQNDKYLNYLMGKNTTPTTPTTPIVPEVNLPKGPSLLSSGNAFRTTIGKGNNLSDNIPISLSALSNPYIGQSAMANGKAWQWDGAKWNEVK
jgi:hypothetical protein